MRETRYLGRHRRSEDVQVVLAAVAPAGPEARGDGAVAPLETPPALPSPTWRVRFVRWLKTHRPPLGITVLVAVGVAVSAITVFASVSVLLPPDGAHYIGDADALLGVGVRPLRHPPLFPALVALFGMVFNDIQAFQAALFASLALFIAGLYVLLRRWTSSEASLIGTAAGAFLPTTAELLGWGGGASLLGIAMIAFALAATEQWIKSGGPRSALLVSVTLALVVLTHPFALIVAAACIGPRIGLLLLNRRRIGLGWDPLGLKGIAMMLGFCGVALVATVPYYAGLAVGGTFRLRLPVITGLWGQVTWAFGGDPFAQSPSILQLLLWGLFLAGLIAIVLVGKRGMVIYAAGLGVVITLVATSLKTDVTYASRSAYLFVFLVAFGTSALVQTSWPVLNSLISRVSRPRALWRSLIVGFVGLVLIASYAPRIQRSTTFHQQIEPGDVQLLERLQGQSGTVAVSWRGFEYGTGVLQSWYLEGLAKRHAFGPAAPWLGEVPEQRRIGLDIERLFAGEEGLDNGVIQLAAGTPGMQTDPGIWVKVGQDFYVPVLYSDSGSNSYPAGPLISSTTEIREHRLIWLLQDSQGRSLIRQVAVLRSNYVIIRYEQLRGGFDSPWSVWFFPAFGVHFQDVTPGPRTIEASAGVAGETVPFRVSSPTANASYFGPDPAGSRPEGIRIMASETQTLEVRVDFPKQGLGGDLVDFDEREILAKDNISTVVLWKNNGWRRRFDLSSCYQLWGEADRILVYKVDEFRCSIGG